MNLDLTVTFIIIFVNSFIGFFIISRNFKKRINQYFFLFLLFLILWKVTLSLYLSIDDQTFLTTIGRINFSVTTLMVYFAVKFANIFPDNKPIILNTTPKNIGYLIISIVIFLVTTFTPLVSIREYLIDGEPHTEFGMLYIIYASHLLISIGLSLYVLNKKRKITTGIFREQVSLIFWSFLFSATFALTTNVLLPYVFEIFSLQPVGPLGTIFISVAVFISIVRYKFLESRIIIGKSTYIFTMASLVFVVFYLLVFINLNLFSSIFSSEAYIFGAIMAAIFVLFYDWADEFIKEKVENTIIKRNINYDKAITEFNTKINKLLDFEHIINETLLMLKKYIGADLSAVLTTDKEYKFKVHSLDDLLDNEDRLIEYVSDWSRLDGRLIYTDEIQIDIPLRFQYKSEKVLKFAETIETISIKLIIPLTATSVTIGFITLGDKINKTPYHEYELDFLESLSSLVSLALTRASLFQEVKNFNATLQHKIDEATKEITKQKDEIAEQLRKERDMMDILGHELRTPLSTSRNAISLMDMAIKSSSDGPLDKSVFQRYIDKALENMRREIKLLETVLSSTKIENDRLQLEMSEVDCIKIINDTVDTMQVAAKKKNLELTSEFPKGTLFCKADKDRVQEIMYNLVDNAIKYTEKGGVKVVLEDLGEQVRFSVTDTGMGIPAEAIPHIGKKFYRVNTYLHNDEKLPVVRPGGTGIGMYVVFGLMKLMKGRVEITSPGVGKGSTFAIYLPK